MSTTDPITENKIADDKYKLELKIFRQKGDRTPLSLEIHLLDESAEHAASTPTLPPAPQPAQLPAAPEPRTLEEPSDIIEPDPDTPPEGDWPVWHHPGDKVNFLGWCTEQVNLIPSKKTRASYMSTLRKIAKFDSRDPAFSDLTIGWLRGFERYCIGEGLMTNAISVYMRNIRSLYNRAIDEGVAQLDEYPFRRFRIKQEKTRKRSLTLDQLRELRDFDCNERLAKFRDIFMLIFYLRGINISDLMKLTHIKEGYVQYRRNKTGRWYNVKVEPEAQEIIDRYRGNKFLLSFGDTYATVDGFAKSVNRGLKSIGAPHTTELRGCARTNRNKFLRIGVINAEFEDAPAEEYVEIPAIGENHDFDPPETVPTLPDLHAMVFDARIDDLAEHRCTLGNNEDDEPNEEVGVGLFPDISTYWARHTWATIAASLDIPKETIAAGLGHSNNTVTDIYIAFDNRKVDAANRRVIDALNRCRPKKK